MKKTQVYVSFDTEHDEELYERLVEQSRTQLSTFAVTGGSEPAAASEIACEKMQRRIRKADQVIVICGKHTETCAHVGEELRIAKEEGIPHFLLWGRWDLMCTKPIGAASGDGMYSWTRQVVEHQIELTRRDAHADAVADALRRSNRKSGSGAGL